MKISGSLLDMRHHLSVPIHVWLHCECPHTPFLLPSHQLLLIAQDEDASGRMSYLSWKWKLLLPLESPMFTLHSTRRTQYQEGPCFDYVITSETSISLRAGTRLLLIFIAFKNHDLEQPGCVWLMNIWQCNMEWKGHSCGCHHSASTFGCSVGGHGKFRQIHLFSVLQFSSLENEVDDACFLQRTGTNEDYFETPTERIVFVTQELLN